MSDTFIPFSPFWHHNEKLLIKSETEIDHMKWNCLVVLFTVSMFSSLMALKIVSTPVRRVRVEKQITLSRKFASH